MPCVSTTLIQEFVEGSLSESESAELLAHVSSCADCSETYEMLLADSRQEELFHDIRTLASYGPLTVEPACTELITRLKAQSPDIPGKSAPSINRFSFESIPLIDYKLIRPIARGGMGVIYEAEQLSLGRKVAIKFLSALSDASDVQLQRFRNEAQAAARLQHPHIVPVHSFEFEGGVHFLVMQFIDGANLSVLIESLRPGSLPAEPTTLIDKRMHPSEAQTPRFSADEDEKADDEDKGVDFNVSRLGGEFIQELTLCGKPGDSLSRQQVDLLVTRYIDIVNAIEYAHEQDIVHRDVKPSNLLVDNCGKFWVGDFGVAKMDVSANLTATNLIVGTPRYMSPEQVTGGRRFVDHRSDIYSLGTTLYELLTLEPMFKDDSIDQLISKITSEYPTVPRKLNPAIPVDLETIILKAISKEKKDRYQSAEAMAADLQSYLDGEPIAARRPSLFERGSKWLARHKGVALSLLGMILISLMATISIIFLLITHNSKQERLLDLAQRSQFETKQLLYNARMKEAGLSWVAGDARQLETTLNELIPSEGDIDFRGDEWYFLKNHISMEEQHHVNVDSPVYAVRQNAAAGVYAFSGMDAVIHIHDSENRDFLFQIDTGQIEVNGLSFSQSGELLASSGDDGTVCVWSIDYDGNQASLYKRFKAHDGLVFNVLFGKDDQYLMTNGTDTSVRFWDFDTGERITELTNHTDRVADIAYCPSRNRLATVCFDHKLRVFDLDTFMRIETLNTGPDRLTSIAYSPDGSLFVTTSLEGIIHVRNADTGQVLTELKQFDEMRTATFAPDGTAIIAGDRTGIIHLWRLESLDDTSAQVDSPISWSGHSDRVYDVVFSEGTDAFYSVSHDGKVIEWKYELRDRTATIRNPEERESFPDFAYTSTEEGERLLICQKDEVQLRDLKTGQKLTTLFTLDDNAYRLSSSSDGKLIAAAGYSGHIYVYDMERQQVVSDWITGEKVEARRIALSPDGALVAFMNGGEQKNDLYMFDARTGERISQYDSEQCNTFEFSDDGKSFYRTSENNTFEIWDTTTHTLTQRLTGHSNTINAIASSPLQPLIATGGNDRQIMLWQPGKDEPVATIQGHRGRITSMTFSNDGRRLISCGNDRRITVWNIESEAVESLLNIRTGRARPEKVELSRDGRYITCRLRNDRRNVEFVKIYEWR